MSANKVLVRPVLTERTTALKDRYNKVAFEVDKAATKHSIRDAVEKLYGVSVEKVHTSIVHGKTRRRGMSIGRLANWKKAIVTLKQGDNIDFFAQE